MYVSYKSLECSPSAGGIDMCVFRSSHHFFLTTCGKKASFPLAVGHSCRPNQPQNNVCLASV